MIAIPHEFEQSTVAREGEKGAAWVAELPFLVEELLGRWECVPDGDVLHGGVGLVVPVRGAGHGPAVLKVSFPHPGNVHEPHAFAAWGGHGAVRLYARDDARFAMLLERAHTDTLAECGDPDEMVVVAGRISRRLAVPAPSGLPRQSERAAEWERRLLVDAEEFEGALPRRVLEAALATVRELGPGQPDVMIHGDLHPRNILRADREPWLAVDPKGYVGDPAWDGGTLLKSMGLVFIGVDDPGKEVHRALDLFADAAELDPVRVRRWGQLHAVEAAYWARRHGFRRARGGPELDRLTALAEHLAQALTA
ncbi:aminoglycoside phosphotransferase family protein [Streptomyces indicus]|uniref:Streptomycin 6-kinase n=1 Tax=Streptomyces indicus TaxID=417292 RepID=A0A1G8ZMZ3_9ACTN|nr:aminoglycoside phosphotransferase family protein [Streptomyces indicus]SDK15755.1 streptomycin 6-kinase [Streptomyces indicus]